MQIYSIIIALIATSIIHFGFKRSDKITNSTGKGFAKLASILAGFVSIVLLSFDVSTSIYAGRYFFFTFVGYLLLYFFYIKKKWQKAQQKELDSERK